MVAALFVDPRGPYASMPGVDAWDEKRDARGYVGLLPVVAHPPCKGWSSLRHIAKVTAEQRVDCAIPAMRAVRQWGGVLEQPAGSQMFAHFGCPIPTRNNADLQPKASGDVSVQRGVGSPSGALALVASSAVDSWGGYSIEVSQVEWGHVARKRTWLYIVGVPREVLESPPFPGREPTHWVSGGRRHDRKGSGGFAPPGIKICSAQQRNRTPIAFAEYLVRLAQAAHVARAERVA